MASGTQAGALSEDLVLSSERVPLPPCLLIRLAASRALGHEFPVVHEPEDTKR